MTEPSMPQISVVSPVVVVEEDNGSKIMAEGPVAASKARYLDRVKNPDLKELACMREFVEIMELKILYHEDLNSHHCVDWLKANEAHFSREKTLDTADLTGIPKRSIWALSSIDALRSWGAQALLQSHRNTAQAYPESE